MAREDFCFTWYDGDAASDMQHMNRLARGAYYDLVSFQRKVGAFSADQARGILSKDFDECWPSVVLILKVDDEGKYFIEWVRASIAKMKAHSEKQKINAEKRWNKKGNASSMPDECHGTPNGMPLGNGDGNGLGNENKEGGAGETYKPAGIVPDMLQQFKDLNVAYFIDREKDYPQLWSIAQKIHKWLNLAGQPQDKKNSISIKTRWGDIVAHIRGDSFLSKYSLTQINNNFQSILQSFSNGSDGTGKQNGKPGKPPTGGGSRGL